VLGLSSLWSLNFSQFVAHTYGLKRCATRHRWRANFGQQGAFPSDASLYVLTNLTIYKLREIERATLGAGEFFGEIATMQHVPRSASVRALQETTCLVIWRLDFESYIRRFPDVVAKVEAAFSARFADGPDPKD